MAKAGKKGIQGGRKSGGATRRAIRAAEKRGLTQEQIGRAAMRSPGVISAIKTNTIKRPPDGLATKINKGVKGKKSKKKK